MLTNRFTGELRWIDLESFGTLADTFHAEPVRALGFAQLLLLVRNALLDGLTSAGASFHEHKPGVALALVRLDAPSVDAIVFTAWLACTAVVVVLVPFEASALVVAGADSVQAGLFAEWIAVVLVIRSRTEADVAQAVSFFTVSVVALFFAEILL